MIICLGLLALPGLATAGSQSTTMDVTITLTENVSVSVTSMAFGDMPPGVDSLAANTTITVTADLGITYYIALDAGLHYFDGARSFDGELLVYELTDTSTGALLGDNGYGNTYTNGQPLGPYTGVGSTESYGIRGLALLAGTTRPTPGSYSDTVTVTVHY